jgi:hypothetical protein
VRPEDVERVDSERIAMVQVVIDEGRCQVVRGADGVDVAGQVQVEVLHGYDLGVASAGCAALDPEDGA